MYRATAPEAATGSRWATREIAALDFLLNIPLEAEESIVRAGLSGGGGGDGTSEKSVGLAGIGALDISSGGARNGGQVGALGHHHLGAQPSSGGGPATRWWEKLINKGEIPGRESYESLRARLELEEKELERPESQEHSLDGRPQLFPSSSQPGIAPAAPRVAPGRRLEGRKATVVQIPRDLNLTVEMLTSHRTVARQAAVREWEIRVAHGLLNSSERKVSSANDDFYDDEDDEPQGLLDGRAFFSCGASYPLGVFSVIKYEPKKEEAARRRKKLEERGGGGTQFAMPERDWRGISYRALLPRVHKKNNGFRRTLRQRRRVHRRKKKRRVSDEHAGWTDDDNDAMMSDDDDTYNDDTMSMTSSSSEESDEYVPGFLDDPEMVQGRHRHVMVGDRVTGCVVSSTIQFVKPADLKADLNKQFKDRFDGWEPAKEQRKYIGAKVIDGVYTLCDPTEFPNSDDMQRKSGEDGGGGRRRKGSAAAEIDTIRMPPSLTLSKIRRLKQQALLACVRARLEVSTVALACVYFERLCLDCRVDKSNRKLVFAACLLIASKINEKNVAIVHGQNREETKKGVLPSFIKPTKIGKNQFASLFEFFTHEWSISLKALFAAEWGVFAALGFKLQAEPSHVAFHFKRFMKVLEWNSLAYLGQEQYNQWQVSLNDEATRREEHLQRKGLRREREEERLLNLQRDYHKQQQEEEAARRRGSPSYISDSDSTSSRRRESMVDGVGIGGREVHHQTPASGTRSMNVVLPTLFDPPSPGKGIALRGRAIRRPSAGGVKSFIPGLRRVGGAGRPVPRTSSVENFDRLVQTTHQVGTVVSIEYGMVTGSIKRSRSTPSMRNLLVRNPSFEDRTCNSNIAIDMERICEIRTTKSAGDRDDDEEQQSVEDEKGRLAHIDAIV